MFISSLALQIARGLVGGARSFTCHVLRKEGCLRHLDTQQCGWTDQARTGSSVAILACTWRCRAASSRNPDPALRDQLVTATVLGVSRQSVQNWLRRYREDGLAGLVDQPKRPDSSPGQISAEVETLICPTMAHLLLNAAADARRLGHTHPLTEELLQASSGPFASA